MQLGEALIASAVLMIPRIDLKGGDEILTTDHEYAALEKNLRLCRAENRCQDRSRHSAIATHI
jgi:hypothetical protein